VFSATEVSTETVEFAETTTIVVHGPIENRLRSMRKPDSLKELSAQARSIRLGPFAVARSPDGAIGIVCGVDALAVFE
jgi:hypothetical protein